MQRQRRFSPVLVFCCLVLAYCAGSIKKAPAAELAEKEEISALEPITSKISATLTGAPLLRSARPEMVHCLQPGSSPPERGLDPAAEISSPSAKGKSVSSGQKLPQVHVAAISAGSYHTCAIVSGGLWCWGKSANGRLGDGSNTDPLAPVQVSGLASGVEQVAAGSKHTCARTAGGGVKCWGDNGGKLGNGSGAEEWLPVDVTGLTSGVLSIAVGENQSCAIVTGGGLKCWGPNSAGEVGDDTTSAAWNPVAVTGMTSGVLAVSAGEHHTCALVTGGGVKCWGANQEGQLGNGNNATQLKPVDVLNLGSGVEAISAGGRHTCALLTGGGIKCWGLNSTGQLGDDTYTNSNTPVNVINPPTGISRIHAGGDHTCVMTAGGATHCWGYNGYNQLGDGSSYSSPKPVAVTGLASGVASISAGLAHTCVTMVSGGAQCWGFNNEGQLGDGDRSWRWLPKAVTGLSSGILKVAPGVAHACALTSTSGVTCWGDNTWGGLGDGTLIARPVPGAVPSLASGVADVGSGQDFSCVRTSAGGIKCWGISDHGQLGNGAPPGYSATPADVSGLTSGAASLAVGVFHVCARTDTGGLKCWGYNVAGQLGDGTTSDQNVPRDVTGLTGVGAVVAGTYHTCALTASNGVKCWGDNSKGQLGDAGVSGSYSTVPVDVSGLTSGVAAIAAGYKHTCAVLSGGGLKCWGYNNRGQLGTGARYDWNTPTNVWYTTDAVAVAAGRNLTCYLTSAGAVKCWGDNEFGSLGIGTRIDSTIPVELSELGSGNLAIASVSELTCALTSANAVKCWGWNQTGQVGDGTSSILPRPVLFGGSLLRVFIPAVNR